MASHYYPLPGYTPGPGINFEPVNNALMRYSDVRARNEQMAAQEAERARDNAFREKQFGLQQEQFGLTKRNSDFDYQTKKDSLPLDQQTREAQLAQIRAQTTQLGQKNQIDTAIAGMITGAFGQESEAPQPHPTPGSSNMNGTNGGAVIPQGYIPGSDGGPTNALMQNASFPSPPGSQQRNALMDRMPQPQPQAGPQYRPGIVLAADDMPYANGGQQQPAPAQQPPQPANPMAGMTPRRRAAFALGLAGKGDAGKVLLDMENESRLDKAASTENDKAELNAINSLAKLREVASSFDPAFLTYKEQGKNWARGIADKLGYLSKEDQAQLYRFATFRRDAASAINASIKANSGATVTEQELARNKVELVNAGTGIFDGDSPTEGAAKLTRNTEVLGLAVARYRYLRAKGFTGKPWEAGVELEDMRGVINRRAQEHIERLQRAKPQVDPSSIKQEALSLTQKEFGI